MSSVPDPGNPPAPSNPPISAAAESARQRLHEEIERVRSGVEEMLSEQGEGGIDVTELRRELEEMGKETKRYVKKRVAKSEARTAKRLDKLETRLDQVEADRRYAEWRIHTNTEAMLDGLLQQVRAIADLLSE